MRDRILLDFLKLVLVFGAIWAAFYFFPIFPEETSLEISIENEEVLGDLPPGTERAVAGNDVVLLEKATGKILDVISGVLKGN